MREYLDLKNHVPNYLNQTPINLYICVCTLISPNCYSFIQFCHNSEIKRLLLFLIFSAKFIPTLLREAININKTTLTKLRHHKININFPSSETVKFRFSPTNTNSVDYGMLKLFSPMGDCYMV